MYKIFQLVNLPCQASVVNILEAWVHHYTTTQLSHFSEKPSSRNKTNQTIERTVTEINICRETADGIRVYFDFTLHDLLLYRQERQQYCDIVSTLAAAADSNVTIKEEPIEWVWVTCHHFSVTIFFCLLICKLLWPAVLCIFDFYYLSAFCCKCCSFVIHF